ncbi:MAG TPA: isochorismatase family cysteine hydrolase [Blastocatellia bacterium]|nr:isochorismatase family cysteine hydrolase [Blastocatellia bacterium]
MMEEIDAGLRQSFLRFKLPGDVPEIVLDAKKTALLVIDMQYLNAHREGKYGRWAVEQGIQDQLEWYFNRLEKLTVPRIRALIEASRQSGIQVVYTRVASLTMDGREMGWRYKAWNMTDHVDSPESQFLEELAPLPDDLVVPKTCTSVFLGSHLDRYLRNMGISILIACGVATNGCVESAVRDASDLEYRILLAEDGCATLSQQDHDTAVNAMHPLYAQAMSTESIIEKIQRECGRANMARP